MGNERGFTLVEVLVAACLLLVAIFLFLRFSLLSMGLSEKSRRRSEALAVAGGAMDLLVDRGWEGVAGECLPAGPGPSTGDELSRCLREVLRRGRRYSLLLEKTGEREGIDRFTATCAWESDPGRGGSGKVRLLGSRRDR